MKRIALLLTAALWASTLYGQEKRVEFKIDDQGNFYRSDSEIPYYVFEYDGMSAEDLFEHYYSQWHYFKSLPEYFENNSYLNSSYDTSNGIINVTRTYEEYPGLSNRISFHLSFKVQFKDGRVRIDAKDISTDYYGDGFSAYSWIHKFATIFDKNNRSDGQILILEDVTNDLINEFLADIDFEEDWSDIQELEGSDKIYFSINDYQFQYPGGKNSVVYSIDGLTEDELRDAMNVFMDASMFDGLSSKVDFGIKYDGIETLPINVGGISGMLKRNLEFRYTGVFQFRDGLVKVYVPKIRSVYEDGAFHDFKTFLRTNLFIDRNGNRIRVKENSLDVIEKDFNEMIYLPLEYLKGRTKPVQEEDW